MNEMCHQAGEPSIRRWIVWVRLPTHGRGIEQTAPLSTSERLDEVVGDRRLAIQLQHAVDTIDRLQL
jgi:hypothetical protein